MHTLSRSLLLKTQHLNVLVIFRIILSIFNVLKKKLHIFGTISNIIFISLISDDRRYYLIWSKNEASSASHPSNSPQPKTTCQRVRLQHRSQAYQVTGPPQVTRTRRHPSVRDQRVCRCLRKDPVAYLHQVVQREHCASCVERRQHLPTL